MTNDRPIIGFHASHELFPPSALLWHVQRAEEAGFDAAMCSDHYHPWTPEQGESGYSFSWLGAALARTRFPIGTICCPVFRYHPTIVAQAAATLAEMFPDRFWLAIGTGQALNEHIVGEAWPPKPERQARVKAAAEVIRALWAGDEVSRTGEVRVEKARLYSRPERPPLLLGAATSPETAAWVGSWADGLLTVNADASHLKEVIDAFRTGGGEGKPMFLQSMVAYDPDEERAWQAAVRNWPVSALDQDMLQDLDTPEQMARAVRNVGVDDLKGKLRVSSERSQHRDWILDDLSLGFDAVYIYTIDGNPERFIDVYGEHVLPACAQTRG